MGDIFPFFFIADNKMVSYTIDGVLELMEYHCSWEYVGYSLDYFL